MKFIVCLLLSTAGFTSGQSTQEVRAHSGYTQDGRCSYTFVLPPSSVQQCGSGPGEADLQQIREQMTELQNKYRELTEDLRQQNDVLEQRLSALEENTTNTTQPCSWGYLPSTCTEVEERSGINDQTFYVIDPDGPERGVLPMVVQCDVQGGSAITLIGHDSEARTRVAWFDYPGTYSKNVTYWNSMEQVRALVDKSTLCKQHIKYECRSSLSGSFSNDPPASWWVTWDGRQADYWGGASPGSGGCACGESGTCSEPSGKCNCDAYDGEDSGFLYHKDDLPVTQLRFGNAYGNIEEGYHTLGKLICYP